MKKLNLKLTFWRGVFLLITIFGILGTIIRFTKGLGAVTNLSDDFPWGLWIGFDVLCGVALAAGGFTITAIVYIFNLKKYEELVRPAVLTAFLGYLFVILALLFDLGRPWNIWHPIIMWNPHSVMFEVGWCVMLYTAVLAGEFSIVVFEKFRLTRLYKIMKSIVIFLVILGVVFSTLHQSSLGSLFLIVPEKLYPLWYTPLLPFFFFLTAIGVGLSIVVVESYLSHRAFGKGLNIEILFDLVKFSIFIMAMYFLLKIMDMAKMGALSYLFQFKYETFLFILEFLFLLIIPMILFSVEKVRTSETGLFFIALIIVMGVILNRLNVSITGFESYTGYKYLPSWIEVMITLMLVGLEIAIFSKIAQYFPVFKHR
ncbi:MAG: NrfD/PsrC family molybdoenzyme membrane anchor subunit [candidate division WOR-3 bacterium]